MVQYDAVPFRQFQFPTATGGNGASGNRAVCQIQCSDGRADRECLARVLQHAGQCDRTTAARNAPNAAGRKRSTKVQRATADFEQPGAGPSSKEIQLPAIGGAKRAFVSEGVVKRERAIGDVSANGSLIDLC